jgi:hypothetical protein
MCVSLDVYCIIVLQLKAHTIQNYLTRRCKHTEAPFKDQSVEVVRKMLKIYSENYVKDINKPMLCGKKWRNSFNTPTGCVLRNAAEHVKPSQIYNPRRPFCRLRRLPAET